MVLFSKFLKKTATVDGAFRVVHTIKFMNDEIDLELQRLTEIFGRDEVDEAGQIETDAEFLQRIEIWLADSGASEELLDGEIDAELLEKIKEWQRDDDENEPVRNELSDL